MISSVESGINLPTIITAGRTLVLATIEYRNKPTDPLKLWEFQTANWDFNRFAIGLSPRDVLVADCPFNEDQLRKFGRVDFPLYLPQVVSTASEGLKLQVKAYPTMRWDIQNLGGAYILSGIPPLE